MDRNYCFRRKRHSYAACDAALAASLYIIIVLGFAILFIFINQIFYFFRLAFGQFRTMVTQLANHPQCPGFVGRMINISVNYISRLSPATA